MRVLGLVGSPRKDANTDILVDAILEGAKTRGHEVEKLYIHDFDIGPCVDCRGCKKDGHICIVKDGMQDIYPKLDVADAIVFGTPVYWCGPTGTMKQLVDRLRPYFANGRLKGKKTLVAAPAKDGPGEGDLLVEMFRRSFEYLEMEFSGHVLGTAFERKEILEDEQAMAAAFKLGEGL